MSEYYATDGNADGDKRFTKKNFAYFIENLKGIFSKYASKEYVDDVVKNTGGGGMSEEKADKRYAKLTGARLNNPTPTEWADLSKLTLALLDEYTVDGYSYLSPFALAEESSGVSMEVQYINYELTHPYKRFLILFYDEFGNVISLGPDPQEKSIRLNSGQGNNVRLFGVDSPTVPEDAANKQYVDSKITTLELRVTDYELNSIAEGQAMTDLELMILEGK